MKEFNINKLTISKASVFAVFTILIGLLTTIIQSFVATFSTGIGTFWSALLTPLSMGLVVFLSILVIYPFFKKD